MLRQVRTLLGLVIAASDGELGRLDDVYFDDDRWIARYLVVDTGHWLPRRRVLISPSSAVGLDRNRHRLTVALTREQVRTSPDMDTERPVARQYEIAFHRHYGLPYYWVEDVLRGAAEGSARPRPPARQGRQRPETDPLRLRAGDDPHLRSARAMRSYFVQALDDEIGHVEDVLIDGSTWAIRYLVVDTRNWWPGKKVLIPPGRIIWMSWMELKVHVGLRRETIRGAPEYDPSHPIGQEYETRLAAYYDRPPDRAPSSRRVTRQAP